MRCKVCGKETKEIFQTKVLNKYYVQYYQCPNCLFLQTEKEYWIKEAYEVPINITDTGIMSRNISLSIRTSLLLFFLFDRNGKFLDYGGGYGIFTRLMRDIGFDFYWSDRYTENLLSRGFEKKDRKYDCITLFEAFEHFQDPIAEIAKLFKMTDTVIFSTSLTPKPTPKPDDWWYYCTEHGQHIAFYSKETFEYIAQKYNYNFYSDNNYFHILTKKSLPPLRTNMLLSKLSLLLFPVVLTLNKSKTVSDNKTLKRNLEK